MGRPRLIEDSEILSVARAAFLAEGVGASTIEIARKLGISESVLFKRFGTKQSLFMAAMNVPLAASWADRLRTGAEVGLDLESHFEALVFEMLGFFRAVTPSMLVAWGPRRALLGSATFKRDPPATADLRTLIEHLEALQQERRLGPCDPRALARALVGAAQTFVLLELMGVHEALPMDDDAFARGIVHVVLHGALPGRPSRSPKR